MAKRIKFEIHVKVSRGTKATKASLTRAVKAWVSGDTMPDGHLVSVIRWQKDNHKRKEAKGKSLDSEREWLGRLLPWATIQIQAIRSNQ